MIWYEIIASVLGGGAVVKAIDFLRSKRGEIRTDFQLVVDTIRDDNSRLRSELATERVKNEKELEEQRKRISDLENELSVLRAHLIVIESSHYDHPYPMWLKGLKGEMIVLNKAYEKMFLNPIGKASVHYIGHTDYEIWPREIADEYAKNDDWVMRTGNVWEGEEHIIDRAGKRQQVRVVKFPRYNGRQIIGISGQVIPEKINKPRTS